MRRFIGALLVAAVALMAVGCKKDLPEQEIYGTWVKTGVSVDFKLKGSNSVARKVEAQLKPKMEHLLGGALLSFTCEPNNQLEVEALDMQGAGKGKIKMRGAYFYYPSREFKMEITEGADDMMKLYMLFFGGFNVGMKYMPELTGEELQLELSPGVAKATVEIMLGDAMLPSLLTMVLGDENALTDPIEVAKLKSQKAVIMGAAAVFLASLEEVTVRLSLRRE